jgi:hypothetical protein
MSTKRIFASLCLLALTACSDDEPTACVGHLCGSDVKITDPDGGNVLFEYIYFDSELQAGGFPATANRVMVYFTASQSPSNNTLPKPGECNNLVATKGWPTYPGDAHMDLDVGEFTITGKNKAGADVTITVPKGTMPADQIGRKHEIFYQVVNPNADNFLQLDSSYTVKFGGAGNVPATTIDDALFLSAEFSVNSPGLNDNGPLRATQPYTVKWTPATSKNLPAGGEVLGLTWLLDTNTNPTHLCAQAHSAGEFTIPAAAIAEYRQIATARGTSPDKMVLLRNAVVHQLSRLPTDETPSRRIDMLTVNCWVQLMDVVP